LRFLWQWRCRFWSYGLQHHVDFYADTNFLEEHTASIFNPKDGGSILLQNVGIWLQMHTAFNENVLNCYLQVGLLLGK
jgi:hypothetical protein